MKDGNKVCKTILKLLVITIFITVFIIVVVQRQNIYDRISLFTNWMSKHAVLGPFVLSVVIMLGEVFFIPGTLLKMGAGYAFKRAYKDTVHAIVIGSVSAWTGISIGAVITMLLGRFVFKE